MGGFACKTKAMFSGRHQEFDGSARSHCAQNRAKFSIGFHSLQKRKNRKRKKKKKNSNSK
jgi:hypothetical protein